MDPRLSILKNKYSVGPFFLASYCVMTAICFVLSLFGISEIVGFPLQSLALWFSYHAWQYGLRAADVALGWISCVLAVVPVIYLLVCRLRCAKENYKWVAAAIPVMLADTLFVMLDLFRVLTRDKAAPLALVIHVIAVCLLFGAAKAGMDIKKGLKKLTPSTPEQEAAARERMEKEQEQADIICRHNKEYARKNHALKRGWVPVAVLAFAAVMVLDIVVFMSWLNMELGLDTGFCIGMFLLVLIADIVFLFLSLLRLSVFFEGSRTTYVIKPNGTIVRHKAFEPVPFDRVEYREAMLLFEKRDRWIIEYTARKGRRRRAFIPKAFPEMDKYMRDRIKIYID